MKLSAHHSTYGLEGTVRLLSTGETFHIVFPKGKYRAEAQVNIGGHRFETAFVLEPIPAKPEDEIDMQIAMVVPHAALASQVPTRKVVSAPVEVLSDGSPMVGNTMPIAAAPKTKHFIKDGLPPGPTPEPAVRELTARESKELARMVELEKKLGAKEEVPAVAPKKGKKARSKEDRA